MMMCVTRITAANMMHKYDGYVERGYLLNVIQYVFGKRNYVSIVWQCRTAFMIMMMMILAMAAKVMMMMRMMIFIGKAQTNRMSDKQCGMCGTVRRESTHARLSHHPQILSSSHQT